MARNVSVLGQPRVTRTPPPEDERIVPVVLKHLALDRAGHDFEANLCHDLSLLIAPRPGAAKTCQYGLRVPRPRGASRHAPQQRGLGG